MPQSDGRRAAKTLRNGEFEVYSAGLRPSHVHPLAIKAMAELDIDITNQYSKTVNEFIGQEFSYVVTVCGSAKELCPVFPRKLFCNVYNKTFMPITAQLRLCNFIYRYKKKNCFVDLFMVNSAKQNIKFHNILNA